MLRPFAAHCRHSQTRMCPLLEGNGAGGGTDTLGLEKKVSLSPSADPIVWSCANTPGGMLFRSCMHMLPVSNQRVQEMGGRVDDGAITVEYQSLRARPVMSD